MRSASWRASSTAWSRGRGDPRRAGGQVLSSGFAELAKGVLHNLGNAMTPLSVRLARLDGRLRDMPVEDLELACAELKDAALLSPRHADLIEFLRLGCREVAAGLTESKSDVQVIQRQAQTVQSALSELMRSTRNDAVIETVRLPDLVNQTLEIVPDACRQRLLVDPEDSLGKVGAVRVARTVLRLVLQNLIIKRGRRRARCRQGEGRLEVECGDRPSGRLRSASPALQGRRRGDRGE